MTSVEGVRRNDIGQNRTMFNERLHRKVSEDVTSLDSWTDALNVPSPTDSSFPFVSEENRLSGSGFTSRPNAVNIDKNKHIQHGEDDISWNSSPDRNYDVVDSASNPFAHRHLTQTHDVHINHSSNPLDYPDHLRHTNHTRQNFTNPEDPRLGPFRQRGGSTWFNNLVQTNSSPTVHQPHYRPHAFSTNGPHSGAQNVSNMARFGISAQSRLGLPHTNIQSSGQPGISKNRQSPSHQSSSNGGEFGSDTISDQIDRESERLKTKFLSAWNNVKYGWTLKTKTNFRCDSPIFLLGKCYHRRAEAEDLEARNRPQDNRVSNLDEFHQDFSSRMWFTYRREFSPLPGTKLTTDCGWGCMLRSGQMLLAQGLVTHFLGRDWRVFHDPKPEQKAFYKEIIRWFADQLSDQIPFSVHKMVEIGVKHGKEPGDWYGPASIALILRDSLIKSYSGLPVLNDVCVYVAQDCTVYKQDVIDLCVTRPKSSSQLSSNDDSVEKDNGATTDTSWKRSVIVLVPMRLGGECLNSIYIPCVKSLLAHDNCIGIIGGKPKHSMYFVGWQEDKLINLDPHYCQDIVDTSPHDFPVQSFHCVSPRKMPFSKMDPSCTVGFYIRNREEFDKFVRAVREMVNPPRQKGLYPLFIFSEGRSSDIGMEDTPYREQGRLRIRHYRVDKDGNVRSPTMESEDFVIL